MKGPPMTLALDTRNRHFRPGRHRKNRSRCPHLFCGASPFAPPTRVPSVVGSNETDGADLAVFESVSMDRTSRNWRQVVIGSDDHTFAIPAGQLSAHGKTLRPQRQANTALKCA